MRRLLAREHDVEDGVQTAGAREDATQIALGDADRVRSLAVAVEDAWDEALLAQASGVGGAASFALPYFQLDPFAGHYRR